MARKEGMVVMDVEIEGGAITVDLNLDDDEVAIGGVRADGVRILYKAIDDGTGKGLFPVVGVPGSAITSPADTAVGPAATAPLPVPPAGTRRMRVQVTGGDATTQIRIREAGGTAGTGVILTLLGSTMYGEEGGSVAALEAQNVVGPAAAVAVQFEG